MEHKFAAAITVIEQEAIGSSALIRCKKGKEKNDIAPYLETTFDKFKLVATPNNDEICYELIEKGGFKDPYKIVNMLKNMPDVTRIWCIKKRLFFAKDLTIHGQHAVVSESVQKAFLSDAKKELKERFDEIESMLVIYDQERDAQ